MKKFFRYIVWLPVIAVTFFSACSKRELLVQTVDQPVDRLNREIAQIINNPLFANAHWGVAIQSLQNGQYLFLQNENKGFMPASNMKLFTTATALVKLGPDYTFQTEIFRQGKMDPNGVLNGDLIIRGSGDPTLGGRYIPETERKDRMLDVLNSWAEQLKKQGIRSIRGRIVGDDNLFDDQLLGRGWAWDDEPEWYAAQISALSFNDNCIDIYLMPADTLNGLAKFEIYPATQYVQIQNEVKTVADNQPQGIHFEKKRGTNQIIVQGAISINAKVVKEWFSVENPTGFMISVFKEILLKHGVKVEGKDVDIDDLPEFEYVQADSTRLLKHQSPPLKQIIQTINKISQNLWAELLFRTLGAHFTETGKDTDGMDVVKSFLSEIGIAPEQIGIADGSGLSRLNLVTPMQVITLLRFLHNHQYQKEFYESLPIAGIDGTIKGRMRGTRAQNNVHAKTGFISRVRALSGYVTSLDNEKFVFSLITNNYTVPTSTANNIQDLICERLANFSRK
ncbi:D-alanyl-D-alanine carboxypeptidase/D-alanyl-D-alanine-endopeptidase [candidate division KSB1 bacterium]|nr:D-alanyl-D-alanine carboxypeptidase/D-alanyl-D-alanine-endopeptidase [candidate division KSB1 bacterium]